MRIPEIFTVILFLLYLIVVSVHDIRTMKIPDKLVLCSFVLGIIAIFTMPETDIASRIIGMFAGSLPLLLLTLMVPGAFGGGDIKLMAGCGFFLGTKPVLLSLVFAVLSGGIWGIVLLAGGRKGRKDHFAFGPFLCLGMVIAMFAGERILEWYLEILRV